MDNKDDRHPTDQWEDDAEQSQKDLAKQAVKDTSLLHAVFCTPHGQLLLDQWKDHLMMSPSATKGCTDLVTIGINEGQKQFIRGILEQLKLHEALQ